MAIWEIIIGLIKSELASNLKEKGIEFAKDIWDSTTNKVGEKLKSIVDSYVEEKINGVKKYIDEETKRIKAQVIKFVIIGGIIQTVILVAILFLFFRK